MIIIKKIRTTIPGQRTALKENTSGYWQHTSCQKTTHQIIGFMILGMPGAAHRRPLRFLCNQRQISNSISLLPALTQEKQDDEYIRDVNVKYDSRMRLECITFTTRNTRMASMPTKTVWDLLYYHSLLKKYDSITDFFFKETALQSYMEWKRQHSVHLCV